MKKLKILLALVLSVIAFLGCKDEESYYDTIPPSPPSNITTLTGDNRIDIQWRDSPESDVAGYNIYVNDSYEGKYTLIGNTPYNYFVDLGAVNGYTYYYAISAYDYNGNESELSYDIVYDTPRPEGFNQSIFEYKRFPNNSGYSFSEYLVVPYDDDRTDFFYEKYNGKFYLDVWSDSDIQDMGETYDIYDVSQAPINGWVPLVDGENIKYTEAFVGHTYVIWTWDNHFAKVRISSITPERIVFDWAYQIAEGNPELKTARGSGKREVDKNVVRK